jgi:hypothetical protein
MRISPGSSVYRWSQWRGRKHALSFLIPTLASCILMTFGTDECGFFFCVSPSEGRERLCDGLSPNRGHLTYHLLKPKKGKVLDRTDLSCHASSGLFASSRLALSVNAPGNCSLFHSVM